MKAMQKPNKEDNIRICRIPAYEFRQLSDRSKHNVVLWLDLEPLDYEKEDGSIGYDYFHDMDEEFVQEHCEMNGYYFSENGTPIHNLLIQ